MKIDVHTHIFPPEICRDRGRFFSSQPAFRLLYDSPKAPLATAERLLEVLDEDEVDRAVVFGFPWQGRERVLRHNDYVLEAAARYPRRLIPFACVHPLDPEAPAEADRCCAQGAAGLGELGLYEPCDPAAALAAYDGIFRVARSYGKPLLVHANEPVGHAYPGKAPQGLDFYYRLAQRAEGIPLILAHWGGGLCFYEMMKKEVAETLSHVFYDTAASPFLYRASVYRTVLDIVGKERVLLGSDGPLLRPRRYFHEMQGVLSPEEMRAVCGENAGRLLSGARDDGFEGPSLTDASP
ncbi:MAG TPA: TatD family hydrolase [Syntrophobacteraceae bacterium]|nr:TatD family hydrolase [Syntrophobacteraceae bacterium]